MPSKGYKITRSNYTLKQRHQTVSGGVVYERDFMTTTNLGGWDSGSIPYGEGNFKMYYRESGNTKKRPYQGKWVENQCSGVSSEYWTAECVGTGATTEEKLIKINPNYHSLLDFAYYGSCSELVKSTINDIVSNFPAELYTNDISQYDLEEDGYDYVLINPFNVDLSSEVVPDGENPNRYFLESYTNYNIIIGDNLVPITSVAIEGTDGTKESIVCGNFKLIINEEYSVLSKRFADGDIILFADFDGVLRMSDSFYDNFFDNLDDFEKVLLNRGTNPLYTATLDTPHETERGIETFQCDYVWPLERDITISVDGAAFSAYVKSLLDIAAFYDEHYTDNLWRMLTHDSIKAMDLAYTNPEKDENEEDYSIGVSRLEGFLWAVGRQFDEIKRRIDNLKNTSKVSYDGNNNVPDYFLSDTDELSGWEIYDIERHLNGEKTGRLFSGVTSGFDSSFANTQFLRNLKLNSRSILSKKGTKESIEGILGLFGMISSNMFEKLSEEEKTRIDHSDYEITEYVGVVTGSKSAVTLADNDLQIENLNRMKNTLETDMADGENFDTVAGIPVELKYVEGEIREKKTDKYEFVKLWFGDDDYHPVENTIKIHGIEGSKYLKNGEEWAKMSEDLPTLIGNNRVYLWTIQSDDMPTSMDFAIDMGLIDIDSPNGEFIGVEEDPIKFVFRVDTEKFTPDAHTICAAILSDSYDVKEGTIKYAIPWHSRLKAYDGGLYFQQNGGWGFHIIDADPDAKFTDLSGYDETVKYIFVAENVSSLVNIPTTKIYNGAIAYVGNVSEEESERYGTVTGECYFTLVNKDFYYKINDEERQGWQYVSLEMTTTDVEIAKKIYYVESIVEDFKANNPHVGYGMYDMGEEYLDYLRNPLRYSVSAGTFNDEAYDCNGELSGYYGDTFEIDGKVSDNMKCWYFDPISKNGNIGKLNKISQFNYEETEQGESEVGGTGMTYPSSAFTFDFIDGETGKTCNDVTADSLINEKRIKITFYTEDKFEKDFKEFLRLVILPYLRQVIPSTAIFEYEVSVIDRMTSTVVNTTGAIITNAAAIVTNIGDRETGDDLVGNYNDSRILNISE